MATTTIIVFVKLSVATSSVASFLFKPSNVAIPSSAFKNLQNLLPSRNNSLPFLNLSAIAIHHVWLVKVDLEEKGGRRSDKPHSSAKASTSWVESVFDILEAYVETVNMKTSLFRQVSEKSHVLRENHHNHYEASMLKR